MLRPDLEFDDPDDEEWAAYILDYIEKNMAKNTDGFTRMMLCEQLDIEYNLISKYLGILRARNLIKSDFYAGGSERIALPDFELKLPELTTWQSDMYQALFILSKGEEKCTVTMNELLDGLITVGRQNPQATTAQATFSGLLSKKYITIETDRSKRPYVHSIEMLIPLDEVIGNLYEHPHLLEAEQAQ